MRQILFVVMAAAIGAAQTCAATERSETVGLNGVWSVRGWETPDRGAVRDLADVPDGALRLEGVVPGDALCDLERAGRLPDTRKSKHTFAGRAWEGHQWLYERTFVAPPVRDDERAVLVFEGLDTLADIFLNGKKIGEAENFYIPHEFDVTAALRAGETNTLAVLFRSAVTECARYEYGVIGNMMSGGVEVEQIRKPQHSTGWDIMPRRMTCGIYDDCRLEVRNVSRIKDVFYIQQSLDTEKRTATYCVNTALEGPFRRLDNTEMTLTVSRGGKVAARADCVVRNFSPRFYVSLRDVDLWWPRGFGEPVLYDFTLEWKDRADGTVIARDTRRIGVRRIEFEYADWKSERESGEMLFRVNGQKCFIRGTNWTPTDACAARAKGRIVETLELVKELNCNMVRVWGGGCYESEVFWDWCDANGVMVWQDVCMACSMFPQNDAKFTELFKTELRTVIRRLRNHASLALWCGNNENDSCLICNAFRNYGIDPNKDVNSRRIVPEMLWEFDPTHPYLPSSPYISPDALKVNDRSNTGKNMVEWHYYRRWWKSDLFTKSSVKFSSELGFHAPPCVESLREMFDEDSVYPWTARNNEMWPVKYDAASAELRPSVNPTESFRWNDQWQTSAIMYYKDHHDGWVWASRNNRMLLQIKMLWDRVLDGSAEEFVEQSQITQAEAYKFIMEFYRYNKFDKKTGMCWWNVRDGWPAIADSVTDYFGRRKRAFRAIQTAQRTLLVTVNEAHELVAVNDALTDSAGRMKVTDVATGRMLFEGEFRAPANAVARVAALNLTGQGVVFIDYTDGAETARNHYLYGQPPFDYARFRPWLKPTTEISPR